MRGIFCLIALLACVGVACAGVGTDLYSTWFNDQRAEILDELKPLNVEGTLPAYLKGGLYRVGPAIVHAGERNYTNFLDAFGRISQWRMDGESNSVSFNSAIIRSKLLNESLALEADAADGYHSSTSGSLSGSFNIEKHVTAEKTDPPQKVGMMDVEAMDNTDVNVFKWSSGPNKDKVISMTDFYIMNEIDGVSLRTLGGLHSKEDDTQDGDNFPDKAMWSGSHPSPWNNPADGKTYLVNWIGTKTVKGAAIYAYAMDENNARHALGRAEVPFVPYSIHSVAVADSLLSVHVGAIELKFMKTGMNFCISCSTVDKLSTDPAHLFVFDLAKGWEARDTKDGANTPPAASILQSPQDFPPTFVYHHINARAFQSNDLNSNGESSQLLDVDVCAYESMDGLLGDHVLGNMQDVQSPAIRNDMAHGCTTLRRLHLDVSASKLLGVTDMAMRDASGNVYQTELASINPSYWGKDACFTYSVVYHYNGSERYEDMAVVKTDICAAAAATAAGTAASTTTVVAAYHEQNVYVGEPVFVADPAGAAEDAGVLLVVTRVAEADETRLVVLDAVSLLPVASVTAPFPTMFEFHGQWFGDSSN